MRDATFECHACVTCLDEELNSGAIYLDALTNLEILSLEGPSITDSELQHISNWPALEQLLFVDSAVTDAGIAKLTALPNLTWLHLDGNPVTDAAMDQIDRFAGLEVLG